MNIIRLELPAKVREALARGSMVEAIRLLHTVHHIGLREAKDLLDEYIKSHPSLELRPGIVSPKQIHDERPPIDGSFTDKSPSQPTPVAENGDCAPSRRKSEESSITTTSEKFVNGEVWINNKNTGARFYPYFCKFGLWLHNRTNSWGGPHTDINITPIQLASVLATTNDSKIVVTLEGPNLGKIDDLSGYAAVDEGNNSRKILIATLLILRMESMIRFEFEGETDYLDLTSVRHPGPGDLKSRGRYVFRIWFEIPNNELSACFKDESLLNAITAYAKKGRDYGADG